jgi:hypothetical protein
MFAPSRPQQGPAIFETVTGFSASFLKASVRQIVDTESEAGCKFIPPVLKSLPTPKAAWACK